MSDPISDPIPWTFVIDKAVSLAAVIAGVVLTARFTAKNAIVAARENARLQATNDLARRKREAVEATHRFLARAIEAAHDCLNLEWQNEAGAWITSESEDRSFQRLRESTQAARQEVNNLRLVFGVDDELFKTARATFDTLIDAGAIAPLGDPRLAESCDPEDLVAANSRIRSAMLNFERAARTRFWGEAMIS